MSFAATVLYLMLDVDSMCNLNQKFFDVSA